MSNTMSRYVLRRSGSQARHHGESGVDTAAVAAGAGARVIDDAPDMLLVEANSNVVRKLTHLLPEWQVCAETVTPLPRVPRPAIRAAARRSSR